MFIRHLEQLCHSRSTALLRLWQPLCYSCGIRFATVVAYALLRSWHTPCYDCSIRYWRGERITNVTGCE
ncbi:MAG: hypothetical protein J6K41_01100 [Paraprevotella sp.]|nr:hypothetical protein [Paraprevotella sp.]